MSFGSRLAGITAFGLGVRVAYVLAYTDRISFGLDSVWCNDHLAIPAADDDGGGGAEPAYAAGYGEDRGQQVYEPLIVYNRYMVPVFTETGMTVNYVESRDGHSWESWRDRLRDGLSWIFPGESLFVYE